MKQPRVKLPVKWTNAQVRVNEQGKVQVRINPAKLRSGGRFAKCVESVEAKGGAVDPRAVCASAGRAKYGKRKFQAMAAAGRRRARRNPSVAFNVYLGGKLIDTVFYSAGTNITAAEVKRSLVNHDGYDPRIRVTKRRKNPSKRKTLKRVRVALKKYVRKVTKTNRRR